MSDSYARSVPRNDSILNFSAACQAIQAKMDLHDLAEELPIDWPKIPGVAQKAYEAFKVLESNREELKTQSVG